MSGSSPARVSRGVPTGGQFAASARSESGVALTTTATTAYPGDFDPPTGPEDTRLDPEARESLAHLTLLASGRALRADQDDPHSHGYLRGTAQIDAEAFYLIGRPDVPPPHEVAWHASKFVETYLAPGTGSMPTRADQDDFVANIGPYAPMSVDHAAAVSDHFMVRAIQTATTLQARGPHINDTAHHKVAAQEDGTLYAACENAIRFRTGTEIPSLGEVQRLRVVVEDHAADQARYPRRREPTASDGQRLFARTF